jgi:hypothetical protein
MLMAKSPLRALNAIVFLLLAAPFTSAQAQSQPKPVASSYHLVENWLHLPAGQPLGSMSWIDFDSDGTAYFMRRCAACGQHPREGDPPSVIWTFDKNGNFLREWGEGPIAKEGHSIRVDRNGFIWITDTGAHQVKKFGPDGKLLMTLGKYGVAGEGPDTFNMPTDTLVVANGDLFVTDGYGNHRVVKFNKDGKFLKTWGTLGTAPGQFRIPHSIVQDSRGRLIVSDRCGLSNTGCTGTRIQIFDTDGNFLDQWTYMAGDERYPFASPCSLYITKDDTLYVEISDRIYIANALTGKMLDVIEKTGPNHGIAVDQSGDVYIAGLDRGGVHRYSRRTPQ